MKLLFLGPECVSIEKCLRFNNIAYVRSEERLSCDWVKRENFHFCLSYRYKTIIRKEILDYFNKSAINMHISLLPWNKGADPNLWSILEDTPTGVTIHRIDSGIDTGNILLQKNIHIDIDKETLKTSYEKLSREIENLFVNNINALLNPSTKDTPQEGNGSFHLSSDKMKFMHLLKDKQWNTPLKELHKQAL